MIDATELTLNGIPHDAAGLLQLIRSSKKRREKLIEVEEWGCSVLVRGMSGLQQKTWEALPRDEKNNLVDVWHGLYLVMCWGTVHPETREPLFDAEDAALEQEVLREHGWHIISMLAREVFALSQMGPKNLEEARKNLEPTQTLSTTDG